MYKNFFDPDHYSEQECNVIAKLLCFNADLYLSLNPDLAGVENLLSHFLTNGMYEQRAPWSITGLCEFSTQLSSDLFGEVLTLLDLLGFDQAYYLETYSDVENFAAPALQHFLLHGMRERRRPFDFVQHTVTEELAWYAIKKHGLPKLETLDQQITIRLSQASEFVQLLLVGAMRAKLKPKAYRNSYWAALAIGLAALGYFGAATVCYNYFYNYMLPMPHLGNWQENIYVCGKLHRTVDYVQRNAGQLNILAAATKVLAPDPIFLNRPNPPCQEEYADLPAVYYCQLRGVSLFGLNSLIQAGSHDFLYEYHDEGSSDRPAQIKCPNILHWINQDVCLFSYSYSAMVIPEAISLLHDHAHNYFHWLIEVLPRYLLARQQGLLKGVPVLIDEKLSPLLNNLLLSVVGDSSLLIRIPRGLSVRVEKLHWISELSKNTVHTDDLPLKTDILLSPIAFSLLREVASNLFREGVTKYEKILINRSNVSFRRLVNRHLLHEVLESEGYWCVDTGTIDFEEQVRVFSNARIVVGEAGAALANLVFCRPGTTVIVLVNGYETSNYYYLAQMASNLGLNLRFVACFRLIGSHKMGVHDDMIVDVQGLCEAIRQIQY